MIKIVILIVVLVTVFAFTISASAGGNGPAGGVGSGDGTSPVGGLGPIGGNGSSVSGSGNGLMQQGTRGIFDMSGTIAAIGTSTVTINVLHGNKLVQPYIGTQVTVTVASQTRYLYRDSTTNKTISFADLQMGQPVSVHGAVADSLWTASRITVGASLGCLP